MQNKITGASFVAPFRRDVQYWWSCINRVFRPLNEPLSLERADSATNCVLGLFRDFAGVVGPNARYLDGSVFGGCKFNNLMKVSKQSAAL